MAEFSKEDQRSFVKIQVARGQSVQDITQQLAEARFLQTITKISAIVACYVARTKAKRRHQKTVLLV